MAVTDPEDVLEDMAGEGGHVPDEGASSGAEAAPGDGDVQVHRPAQPAHRPPTPPHAPHAHAQAEEEGGVLDALVERLAGLIEPGDYAPEDMENDRIATTIRPQLDEWTDGAASEAMLAERLAIVANRLLERGANEAWPPIVELVIGLVVLTWGILTRDPPEDDAEAITGAATKADVPMIEDPDAEGSA